MVLDSLLVFWKLTVLSFFLHGPFVVKYADSAYQRDFFLCETLVHQYTHQIRRIRVTAKNFRFKSTLFFNPLFFLRASVSSLLNKESKV